MRRDEQCSPVPVFLVFLATMPSAPARDRRRRGAGGGSWHFQAYGILYDLSTEAASIHLLSISFRLASGGGGGVGGYQPALGRQGRRPGQG